jgi:hypothetical protein
LINGSEMFCAWPVIKRKCGNLIWLVFILFRVYSETDHESNKVCIAITVFLFLKEKHHWRIISRTYTLIKSHFMSNIDVPCVERNVFFLFNKLVTWCHFKKTNWRLCVHNSTPLLQSQYDIRHHLLYTIKI